MAASISREQRARVSGRPAGLSQWRTSGLESATDLGEPPTAASIFREWRTRVSGGRWLE